MRLFTGTFQLKIIVWIDLALPLYQLSCKLIVCIILQGVQLLVDVYNGFGGLASSVLDLLSDDYAIKSLYTAGFYPPHISQVKVGTTLLF